MDVDKINRLGKFWQVFEPLSPVRDPMVALLHPYYFGQGENVESRVRAARFVSRLSRRVKRFAHPYLVREWTVGQAAPGGLFLEFGVAEGYSTNQIASKIDEPTVPGRLFAFDSFAGLPEGWRKGVGSGTFARKKLPQVRDNVTLIVGLFQDSLEGFLSEHRTAVSFVHLDCDLYSSASFVLSTLLRKGRMRPGTIILFDELFNYPGWFAGGEYRALVELLPSGSLTYEFIAVAPAFQQVAIRLLERS